MTEFVVKKDGTKVPFSAEKIHMSIVGAGREANITEEAGKALADQLTPMVTAAFEDQTEVPSADIREEILTELEETSPNVAEAWKKYEASKAS